MTAVVISQPMLFPWPGFFEQMMLADAYLWLDDVQFSKGSFTNRVQVLLNGEQKWMTIPLAGTGSFQIIRDLVEGKDFRASHLALLKQSLALAPFKREALKVVDEAYSASTLCETLIASAELPAQHLGINVKPRRTSDMQVDGTSWERVLKLVKVAGGSRYVTGQGARNYMDHEAIEREGIVVEYMQYSKTTWPRLSIGSTPFVSVLDLIAHAGPEAPSYLHPRTIPWRNVVQQYEGS